MTEYPITFSAPALQALNSGIKTQERRPIKSCQNLMGVGKAEDWNAGRAHPRMRKWEEWGPQRGYHLFRTGSYATVALQCPWGKAGDQLWVREWWRTGQRLDALTPYGIEAGAREAGYSVGPGYPACPLRYERDGQVIKWGDDDARDFGGWGKLRHPNHMPRWASRLTLLLIKVWVQELRQVTEAEAVAEGLSNFANQTGDHWGMDVADCWENSARAAFVRVWNSEYPKIPFTPLSPRPLVWALEFKKVGLGWD